MGYPVKTLSQLRPFLQGFRKAAGFTQAMMASHLGVTQQTYAQLEANPAAVSVERLFKVLRMLDVDLTLTQAASQPQRSGRAPTAASPAPSPLSVPARRAVASKKPAVQAAKAGSAAAASQGKRTTATPSARKKQAAPATSSRAKSPAKQVPARMAPSAPPSSTPKATRKTSNKAAPTAQRGAGKTGRATRVSKDRENW